MVPLIDPNVGSVPFPRICIRAYIFVAIPQHTSLYVVRKPNCRLQKACFNSSEYCRRGIFHKLCCPLLCQWVCPTWIARTEHSEKDLSALWFAFFSVPKPSAIQWVFLGSSLSFKKRLQCSFMTKHVHLSVGKLSRLSVHFIHVLFLGSILEWLICCYTVCSVLSYSMPGLYK